MRVASFIDRLEKSKYTFTGIATLPQPMLRTVSIQVQFEFLRTAEAILVEGGCFHHGEPPLAFTLEIPFATMSEALCEAQLRAPSIGTFTGHLVSAGEGFEFLASAATGELCSLHLQFISSHAFAVSGMLKLPKQSLSFSARETGEWEKANQAKVFPLPNRSTRGGAANVP